MVLNHFVDGKWRGSTILLVLRTSTVQVIGIWNYIEEGNGAATLVVWGADQQDHCPAGRVVLLHYREMEHFRMHACYQESRYVAQEVNVVANNLVESGSVGACGGVGYKFSYRQVKCRLS